MSVDEHDVDTTSERRQAQLRSKQRTPIRHGTSYGAQQHSARGEQACAECQKARNAYARRYRRRTGSTRGVLVPIELLRELAAVVPESEARDKLAAMLSDDIDDE